MDGPLPFRTQHSKIAPSLIDTLKSACNSFVQTAQTKVATVSGNVLGQLLASDEVAKGARALLLSHSLPALNTLYQNLKKSSAPLSWAVFCALKLQFQAFAIEENLKHLAPEQRTLFSDTSIEWQKLERELKNKPKEEQQAGLAELQKKLPELTQKIGLLVEEGCLIGEVAKLFGTVLGNTLLTQAKKVAPFLFKSTPPLKGAASTSAPPCDPNLNWHYLAAVEKDKIVENGASLCAVRFGCEIVGGLTYDLSRWRQILSLGKDQLKANVLKELKDKNVSWFRYFIVWAFFSIAHTLIYRYFERVANAYFREIFNCLNEEREQRYEPIIHTTLENGGSYYFDFNARLAHRNNLSNEEFQRQLELPNADELYEKMGKDLIKKSGMNCVVVWILKWILPPPKEIVKKLLTSLTDALHKGEYGFNQMLFSLLGHAEGLVRKDPANPPTPHAHSRERMRLVEGLVRNLADAVFMATCKTPSQVINGAMNRSFPADPVNAFLENIPLSVLSEEARKEIRTSSQEELLRCSMDSLADLIEEICNEKSLQRACYQGLAAANKFFTPDPPLMPPEQLDLAVRGRAVNLLSLIMTKKTGLPEEVIPYLSGFVTPYVNSFLTLASNSLYPAFFQRMLLNPYFKNR